MGNLNKTEKYIVFFLLIWTAFHMVLWITAHEASYTEKELFWPFISGPYELPHVYDFREFIVYTFVPWTLFFMGDGLFKPTKSH